MSYQVKKSFFSSPAISNIIRLNTKGGRILLQVMCSSSFFSLCFIIFTVFSLSLFKAQLCWVLYWSNSWNWGLRNMSELQCPKLVAYAWVGQQAGRLPLLDAWSRPICIICCSDQYSARTFLTKVKSFDLSPCVFMDLSKHGTEGGHTMDCKRISIDLQ